MTKARNDAIDRLSALGKKVDAFSDLLDNISSIEDKKKLLWKEINSASFNICSLD